MNLQQIQASLKEKEIDGWLFYDFQHRDKLAYKILDLPTDLHISRRWFYFIPAEGKGNPTKIVSQVEEHILNELPGKKIAILTWEELHAEIEKLLTPFTKIAMQYSPLNNVPYVSIIDAGTLELVKKSGVEIVSAQDLIQEFEGLLDKTQFQSHLSISAIMHEITIAAFDEIGRKIKNGEKVTEIEIQQYIQQKYRENGLISNGSPEVAINEHAAIPHYNPNGESGLIKPGDLVLIDSWAKTKKYDSIYYDFTQMAYVGDEIPERIQEIWTHVKNARDQAIAFEKERLANRKPCYGWEIDKLARNYLKQQNLDQYFKHRLGHSIGTEVHGNAVHLDSLETKDTRQIMPGVLHSVEPGIYIPEEGIGIRSEVNVFVHEDYTVEVTGPKQKEIYKISYK